MNLQTFVFLILIVEKAFGFELEEAVFQGKCKKENLCSQLCYELHDGIFECDCESGFELSDNGYDCFVPQKNISHSYNESKSDEDYSSSDVFYQKGVSFSATLQEPNELNQLLPPSNDIIDAKTEVDNQRKNLTNEIKATSKLQSFNIPRFYQSSSWLAFKPLKGANLVTEINLEFRPEQLNGILLLSGERDDLAGDFMIITLNNGYVEFIFDCGSGKGVIKSNDKVVLHQWNTLMIYRYRWEGWIELNEKRRVRGRSTGIFSRITFRTAVFLGGRGNVTHETLLEKKIHSSKGFSGCVRKFVVNGHSYELSKLSSNEIISTSNLNECAIDQCSFVKCLHGGRCQNSACLCPLGFGGKFCEQKFDLNIPMFNGTSNLRYSALGETAIIWLEIKLVLKPHSEDGLILFSGKNDLGDFIAVYLNFGFIEFTYDLGSGITSVKSKFPLSMHEWHTIKISRTARLAVMKVDIQPEVMTVSPNGFWHLSLPYSLFLGGVSKPNLLPSNLRDRGSFVGCIKMFEVNDRKVELIEDALGGFNVANCNESCVQSDALKIDTKNSSTSEIPSKTNNKKYAFDVVDLSVFPNTSGPNVENLQNDSENLTFDDLLHKRIVRVSLQKPMQKSQGVCFKGGINDSFAIFDFQKLVKTTEKYQSNINIRFKTSSTDGLLFLINQRFPNELDTFMSLSIEKGFMHLRYNQATTVIDIKCNETKVNDGLWHRVRALRKNLKGSLRIDGGRPTSTRTRAKHKFVHVTPGIYLGGVSSSSLPGRPFNGCISDVILNNEEEHHLDLNTFRTGEVQNVNSNDL